jgi:hypothetical protein
MVFNVSFECNFINQCLAFVILHHIYDHGFGDELLDTWEKKHDPWEKKLISWLAFINFKTLLFKPALLKQRMKSLGENIW